MEQERRRLVAAAGLLALLTACTSGPDGGDGAPVPVASTFPATSDWPSVGMAGDQVAALLAQQDAFEQAVDVVERYQQMVVDLFTGTRTDPRDLAEVLVTEDADGGGLLDREMRKLRVWLAQGYRQEPTDAQPVLVDAQPVSFDLQQAPATVVMQACFDGTGITTVLPDGTRSQGSRMQFVYTVVQTEGPPSPRWAIAGVTADPDAGDRTC